jgi:HSP20 family protein
MNTATQKAPQPQSQSQAQAEARPAGQNQNGPQQYVAPEIDIFETRDAYVLQAELPGVNKDGLEITVEDNELTIHGRRTDQPPASAATTLWRESSRADYRRVFELDPAIDTAKIDAKIDQGVLTLRLPKSEQVKPRKVTVSD